MANMRLNDSERQVIKEVSKLLCDVSDNVSHITDENKEALFTNLRSLLINTPMVNGYGQISQIKDKLDQIILDNKF